MSGWEEEPLLLMCCDGCRRHIALLLERYTSIILRSFFPDTYIYDSDFFLRSIENFHGCFLVPSSKSYFPSSRDRSSLWQIFTLFSFDWIQSTGYALFFLSFRPRSRDIDVNIHFPKQRKKCMRSWIKLCQWIYSSSRAHSRIRNLRHPYPEPLSFSRIWIQIVYNNIF